MILTRYCRTKPLVLGIYACAFVTNVCFAGKVVVQSPRGVDNYYTVVGDSGFGGQGLRGVVELQRLMPRDALPVIALGSTAARKTSLFKRALLGPRDSDNDKECGTFPPPQRTFFFWSETKGWIPVMYNWVVFMANKFLLFFLSIFFFRFQRLFLDNSNLLRRRLHAYWRGMLFFIE